MSHNVDRAVDELRDLLRLTLIRIGAPAPRKPGETAPVKAEIACGEIVETLWPHYIGITVKLEENWMQLSKFDLVSAAMALLAGAVVLIALRFSAPGDSPCDSLGVADLAKCKEMTLVLAGGSMAALFNPQNPIMASQ